MNLVENIGSYVGLPGKLLETVRKYGADFISTYGGAALAGAGMVLPEHLALYAVLPAAVTMVCVVNLFERDDREVSLLQTYRRQIAATMTGPDGTPRDPNSLKVADLRDFAEGRNTLCHCENKMVKRELEDNDKHMLSSIGAHIVSGAVFLGAVIGLNALTQFTGMQGFAVALGVGAASLFAFQQIDRSVTDGARSLFNRSEPSAHDEIMALERQLHSGQHTNRMQVFAIMVAGDEALQEHIRNAFNNTDYADLYLQDKIAAAERFGLPRGLTETTKALNEGEIEAEDLIVALAPMREDERQAVMARVKRLHMLDARGDEGQWVDVEPTKDDKKKEAADRTLGAAYHPGSATYFQDRLVKEELAKEERKANPGLGLVH